MYIYSCINLLQYYVISFKLWLTLHTWLNLITKQEDYEAYICYRDIERNWER